MVAALAWGHRVAVASPVGWAAVAVAAVWVDALTAAPTENTAETMAWMTTSPHDVAPPRPT